MCSKALQPCVTSGMLQVVPKIEVQLKKGECILVLWHVHLSILSRDVLEFKLDSECCRNPTVF